VIIDAHQHFLSCVCLNGNASDKNFHNKLQAIKARKLEREKEKEEISLVLEVENEENMMLIGR
jgi:hypothetical protein